MKKYVLCFLLSLYSLSSVEAQQKYWIYLKDKTQNIEKVERLLAKHEVNVIVHSEWLNALSASLTKEQLNAITSLQFTDEIVPINSNVKLLQSDVIDIVRLGKALDQLHADTLISLGLDGTGIKIGIIDAGFMNADQDRYLEELIEAEKVEGYKNFIETDLTDPYLNSAETNDRHGSKVFSFLAGKYDDNYAGLANDATFYLARTDQSDKEYRGEEDYWIAAVEWMHSNGVRLVNSSLGYTNGFDDSEENYTQENVNGEYATITKFTELAIKEKGMTIVISAGNDGNDDFKIISIPADADGVISVGSSGYRYWNKLGYSSIGPEHMDAVKPEISCYAAGGTSFAAPIITGLVASLQELNPELTNDELLDILTKSSHLYPHPNNYLGYGVPDARKAVKLTLDPDYKLREPVIIQATDSTIIELDKSYNIMAFHKKDDYIVLEQEKLRWQNNQVEVYRIEDSSFTTVTNGISVWEINWVQ